MRIWKYCLSLSSRTFPAIFIISCIAIPAILPPDFVTDQVFYMVLQKTRL